MTLREIIGRIRFNTQWAEQYSAFVPRFIEEARDGKPWSEWDADILYEFLENRRDQTISSLQHGHFSNGDISRIKAGWSALAPLFSRLAKNQTEPDYGTYKEIERTLRGMTDQNHPASTHRLIAGLQPRLLCTIVSDNQLRELFRLLHMFCSDPVPEHTGDWYRDSHSIKRMILDLLPPDRNPMDAGTWSWQIFKYMETCLSETLRTEAAGHPQFWIVETGRDFVWIGTADRAVGNQRCHYEFCCDAAKKAGHAKGRIYAEIHFEGSVKSRRFFAERAVSPLREKGFRTFPWMPECDGLRLGDGGYDLSDPGFAEKLFVELTEIDKAAGDTLRQAICEYEKHESDMKEIQHYVRLLEESRNLVLTGAPGTGKTHLAKAVAEAMNAETAMVQFHPSYDYTDFVEGLRPRSNDDGSIGFCRRDGVFKEFCKRALKASRAATDNFEEAWKRLVTRLDECDIIDVPLNNPGRRTTFPIELNEYGTGLASRTYEDGGRRPGEWIKGRSMFFNYDQVYNVYRGLPGVPKGGLDSYRRLIVEMMKRDFGLKDYAGPAAPDINAKKYVFIIDEINRGEISKIFGELFFAADPDYRGVRGRVKTQYQNLVPEDDPFAEGFYVPENVYIIGTMNDIDRSVECMDFAIRRRFAWCETDAAEHAEHMQLDDEARRRMKRLNDAISGSDIGLGKAYHIGGGYFLKVSNGDFESLWKYRLEGLLREYLRGEEDIDGKLAILKRAYDGSAAPADKQAAKEE